MKNQKPHPIFNPEQFEKCFKPVTARGPLQELSSEIRQINKNNGWEVLERHEWQLRDKVPALLALMHTEISEAVEAFRKNDEQNFAEELADTVIRVLDCAEGLGINMDEEIRKKLNKNKTRGFKHGGKRI